MAHARHAAPRRRRGPALDARPARSPGARRGAEAPGPARASPTPTSSGRASLAVEALAGGRRLRRAELLAALLDGGVADHRPARLPPALVPVADRHALPRPDRRTASSCSCCWTSGSRAAAGSERDEALGELAGRFFRGHGPATVKDLARWAGLPVTRRPSRPGRRHGSGWSPWTSTASSTSSTRRPPTCSPTAGQEARGRPAAARLRRVRPRLRRPHLRRARPSSPTASCPGGNGMFRPTVVSRGRVVGTWGWTGRGAAAVGRPRRRSPTSRDDVDGRRPRRWPPPCRDRPVRLRALDQEDRDLRGRSSSGSRRSRRKAATARSHHSAFSSPVISRATPSQGSGPSWTVTWSGCARRLATHAGSVGRAALRADHRVDAVVLDPHERLLAHLAALRPAGAEDDDRQPGVAQGVGLAPAGAPRSAPPARGPTPADSVRTHPPAAWPEPRTAAAVPRAEARSRWCAARSSSGCR